MDAPLDRLVRAVALPGALELRQAHMDDEHDPEDDDGVLATLEIRFARFDAWNEIDSWYEGRFLERVQFGAFKKTMAERAGRIVSLFNHGHDPQIGEKVLGPVIDMGERADGPFMVVELHDTSYGRDLLPGLRAGLYGASYMFRVIGEEWVDEPGSSAHNPQGLPERTIKEIKLYEAGPVVFPADEQASVGVRSLTDKYLDLRTLEQVRAARGGHPTEPQGRDLPPAGPPTEAPDWLRDIDEHDQTLALLRTLKES